ncbi:hypothetical protein [Sphingomonas montanisoli]|uniref:Uncharacterized protein n=1 Tax=Sphingomonas montanisoli TaxID=2606412 RepID=A0A5D9C6I0_9SPHN|nr:hypothetical protein [Sphingomonas montanisoli]TZG25611.1 hypothetical protein FYJ91_11335 [Sphingomonas montanisoli]
MAEAEDERDLTRPTGTGFIACGAVLLFIALVSTFIAFTLKVDQSYIGEGVYAPDPEQAAVRFVAIVIAGSGISLGSFLFGIGFVVRAIWFLPGDPAKCN